MDVLEDAGWRRKSAPFDPDRSLASTVGAIWSEPTPSDSPGTILEISGDRFRLNGPTASGEIRERWFALSDRRLLQDMTVGDFVIVRHAGQDVLSIRRDQ
jgi:hypothetical protein